MLLIQAITESYCSFFNHRALITKELSVMINRRDLLLSTAALTLHSGFSYGASVGAETSVFYDVLLHKGKPAADKLGLRPLSIIYEGALWNSGDKSLAMPPVDAIRREASKAAELSYPIALDIERFPLRADSAELKASIGFLSDIVREFRSNKSLPPLGLYGAMPIRDYWRAIKGPLSPAYKQWQNENDALAPLAKLVDIFFPSIYTFYDDLEGWKLYASAQIAECRRLGKGKKVIPFVWYRFHDSNAKLHGKEISSPFFAAQLAFLAPLCDGIALWGGWQEQWDPSAAWWKAVTARAGNAHSNR